jgi:hypothetical protein
MRYTTADGVLEIEPGFIRITTLAASDRVADNELVYWDEDEWKDDPSLTAQIANAIAVFFTHGAAAVAVRIGKDFDSNGDVTYRTELTASDDALTDLTASDDAAFASAMSVRYANWSLNRQSPWHIVRGADQGLDVALCGRLHERAPEWSRRDRPTETRTRICAACDAFIFKCVQAPHDIPELLRHKEQLDGPEAPIR